MDYEDMIEDEPQPAAEPVEPGVEVEEQERRAKSPWKAFILTGLLAGFIGAVGGGYSAYAALKHFSPAPTVQSEVDFSPLEAEIKGLNDRVSATETDVQNISNDLVIVSDPIDLSEFEDRLAALEKAPSPEIDPDALTALQAAREDGFEWPDVSELEDRVAALEAEASSDLELPEGLMNRLKALEADVETVKNVEPVTVPVLDEELMSKMEARLSALENRPLPAPVVERISILAFPKDKMIAAVEDNQEGGMIQKTLSRHIRVKDANNPLTLIEGIETDLSEGRLAAAAEKFERLPSPVRSAGQAWYESVKASL
ncbi:MAG: hypothetical protein ABJN22_11650 [Litorimonas sp.]